MKEDIKYEEAVRQLEQIAAAMENGEPDIDTLAEQLKRAKQLIKLCRDRLTKTEQEVKQILEAGDDRPANT